MPELINTKYIETKLLYEVTIDPRIARYKEIIGLLDGLGVITDDADLFVLSEEQYEQFAERVRSLH